MNYYWIERHRRYIDSGHPHYTWSWTLYRRGIVDGTTRLCSSHATKAEAAAAAKTDGDWRGKPWKLVRK